jgi:hypothetical protein
MARALLHSPRYKAQRQFLTDKRKEQELSQTALAKRLARHQSFMADLEAASGGLTL